MIGTVRTLHILLRKYGRSGVSAVFAMTNTCIWMLRPFNEMIAAIKKGKIGFVKKWSVADWTPDVISNIASRKVFVIPKSTVNAFEMAVVSTLPRAEKKMTVVATRIMTVELSLMDSKNGEPACSFCNDSSCDSDFCRPLFMAASVNNKKRILAI